MTTVITLAVLSCLGIFAVIVGIVFYLKKSGALRAAADAATGVVKQDVADAVDKIAK